MPRCLQPRMCTRFLKKAQTHFKETLNSFQSVHSRTDNYSKFPIAHSENKQKKINKGKLKRSEKFVGCRKKKR